MDSSNNKTSYLVNTQLPEFVRRDHPLFIEFLETYYKFLEQDGETLYTAKRFGDFYDIDTINQDILGDGENPEENENYHILRQKFYDSFIRYIPESSLSDLTNILKHSKDFYRSAGSEKSLRFLSRILFNKEPEIYYPYNNILKASDGKWFVEKSLFIKNVEVNGISNTAALSRFTDQLILGNTSNATAIVEGVNPYYDNGNFAIELKLSNVTRNFENGELLTTYIVDEGETKTLTATAYSGSITKVIVTDGGAGYRQGSVVPVLSDKGQDAKLIISKVATTNSEGKIENIQITYSGAGYKSQDLLFFSGGGGSGANGKVSIVDTSAYYHPNSYQIIGTTIDIVANNVLQNVIGNYTETYAYTNLATLYVSTSNLGISTLLGGPFTTISLSKNVANSNVYFETGDILFVQNTYHTVVTSNKNYWQITIDPALPGGLNNVSFQVVKKPNVNSKIANSMYYWTYANCGPIFATAILDTGSGYIDLPTISVKSNTTIRSLGILARMEIYSPGQGYNVGDILRFNNKPGSYGFGANAIVSEIYSANGGIKKVTWTHDGAEGFGGLGYTQDLLPTVTIQSQNVLAHGANVTVTSILAEGAQLDPLSAAIGAIGEIRVVSGGYGYDSNTIIDLTTQGNGRAKATANISTGVYVYPGRYLNQDGQLSSYIFLQDRDYYQKYAYVVRIDQALGDYVNPLTNLIHPAGMKYFGVYTFADNNQSAKQRIKVANSVVVISNTSSNTIIDI